MLAAGFAIPGSLTEAEQLKKVRKRLILESNQNKTYVYLTIFYSSFIKIISGT